MCQIIRWENWGIKYLQLLWDISTSLGTNSSMFANFSVFCDVRHVRSSVFGQNVMFRSVWISVLLLCDQTSLGTYSLMFVNCLGFCDVRHVRSSILGQNVMFKSVLSSVLLLCDQTSLWTYSLMFANCSVFGMFDMFEVRFWAKMWCSESSMFGQSMFGVFEVRYFGVCSKTIPK